MKLIPATLLSGFAGAGKTTLLRRLLAARGGSRVAVMVSDLGPGDIEAGLAESVTTDGSIRCRSREHLGLELRKMWRSRDADFLLVESTGSSEPLPLAEVFAVDDGQGTAISRYVKIDTMITVIDAARFFEDIASADKLTDRGLGTSAADPRRVAEVLVAQVELADVICVNKVDLVDEPHLARLESLLRNLNPRARLLRSTSGEVAPSELLDTGLFDFDAARKATGLERSFDLPGEAAEHGFSSFAYRRRRPFHPQRFEQMVHGEWTGVLRSKGVFWLASQSDAAGEWSQAGKGFHHAMAGSFWAATPEAEWPVSDQQKAHIKALWQEPFGDRRQDLAFVVEHLEREAVEKRLDACLLSDAELALGPEGWRAFAGESHGHADHAHDDHEQAGHAHVHPTPFRGHTPEGGHHSA